MSEIQTPTGRSIFFDDVGNGSVILVLPGMTGDRRGIYDSLTNALSRQHRVVVMDPRDSGESNPESDYYTMADLAGDVADLLEGLSISKAHVLGHSLGGMVALHLCLAYPNRVDRLVLMSAVAHGGNGHRAGEPLPPPDDFWNDDPVERVRRLLPVAVGPSYRDRLTERRLDGIARLERNNRCTWDGVMRQQATQSGLDLRDRLHEVQSTTLVICGDADDGLDRAHDLASRLRDARLLILPGVGHLPWLEQPDVVMPAILEFLAEPCEPAPTLSGAGCQ